ncbi:MAG: ferritin-like domain-containing protein [Desmonostoc geniculatum HA4340-LM1]|jgi:hypothetical protein|nr:ferritin-like domain-containing protein [Desmonostoc geniculatum HA4340-LM1]
MKKQKSHSDANTPVERILLSSLNSRLGMLPTIDSSDFIFWDAAFFGLNQVQCFQEATLQEQWQILQIANGYLLEEMCWVEEAGMDYMNKMFVLAETCEERILYSLFAADEATHLAQVRLFVGKEPIFNGGIFLRFLSEVIEISDKAVLMAVVQVVLEGWGLSHYRSLAKACLNPSLRQVLQGFLQAESRHHAAGVIHLRQFEPSLKSLQAIHGVLSQFLQMVQIGPQYLVTAIDRVKGPLSQTNKIQILQELQTEIHSSTRLQLLRSLINGNIPNSVLQMLEEQGSFQPYPANQCIV